MPCLMQTNLARTCGVSQSGSVQVGFAVCLLHTRPVFWAAEVQPSRRHSLFEPCLKHNPRASALAEQPSTEQGFRH